jgi:hypothetical protein
MLARFGAIKAAAGNLQAGGRQLDDLDPSS